ncbi:helix-turn-helix transcriptional regulator [Aquitalea pelogenes]|uniref:helix-turn-helix transcriptional regulator n=1 Tax=Aquitalea pelogenes TaxID=1293573 RepID=UPI0035B47DE4
MRLIKIETVMERLEMSESTIRRRIKAGQFPRPRHNGRASRWIEHEVDEWIKCFAEGRPWHPDNHKAAG